MRAIVSTYLIILALGALTSCGDIKQPKAVTNGGIFTGDQQPLTGEEQAKVATICMAIRQKTAILDSETRDFVFKYTEAPCGDTPSRSSNITVNVEESRNSAGDSVYSFKPQDGKSYVFKEIETTDTGVMKKICETVTGTEPQRPIFTDAARTKGIVYYLTSSNECEPDNDHMCLTVRYGTTQDGTNYTTHTTEVMKFKTTGVTNRGYYVTRQRTSSTGCEEGDSVFKTVLR